jgi:hypothetical protein
MQSPKAFMSMELFSGLVAAEICGACPALDLPSDQPSNLTGLFDWLAAVNAALDRTDQRLLLALDEYEQIDEKIGSSAFTTDLLATMRESIQSHRGIIWVLAGSHDITELTHAPWPSYLVSVRMVEVPPFTFEETRLLLTEPLRHSPLWKPDDAKRPRFDPAFWGDNGIKRIHAEAAGWPHLVQLIAETAVNVINNAQTESLDAGLMEQVLDKAIVRGDPVLRLLLQTESTLPDEWDYLLGFRRRDTQPAPDDAALNRSLRRRLLVEEENDQWRLRVPLMLRWLRERA